MFDFIHWKPWIHKIRRGLITFSDVRSSVHKGAWEDAFSMGVAWDIYAQDPEQTAYRYVRDYYIRTTLGEALSEGVGTLPPSQREDVPPDEVQAHILRDLLNTSEGRAQLAASMLAPLRRRMNHQSFAAQIFEVQPLPLPPYSELLGVLPRDEEE